MFYVPNMRFYFILCAVVVFLPSHALGDAGNADSNLRVNRVEGPIYQLLATQDTLWIAGNGLYRWTPGSGEAPQREPIDTGQIYDIQESADSVWFGTDTGLFQWRKGSPQAPVQVASLSEIYAIYVDDDGTLYLGTNKLGFFQWHPGSPPVQLCSAQQTSWINQIGGIGRTLWIAAASGIYRWEKGQKGCPVRQTVVTGQVYIIHRADSVIWMSAENGLYRWQSGSAEEPAISNLKTGWVNRIVQSGDTVWFGTANGVFYWKNSWASGWPQLYSSEVKGVLSIANTLSGLWLGTQTSLYRVPQTKETGPQLQLANVGQAYDIVQFGSTIWIGTTHGLYRMEDSDSPWLANIVFLNSNHHDVISGSDYALRWKIDDFGWRVESSLVRQRLLILDLDRNVVLRENQVDPGRSEFTITDLPSGQIGIVVEATDAFGHTARSAQMHLSVSPSFWARAASATKILSLIYVITNLVAFVLLTLASRWSYRAFLILTDPVVRKISLYFGFAIKTCTPITLWVFERYYSELKNSFADGAAYLPGIVGTPEGRELLTTDLFTELRGTNRCQRMWIQGKSGTGKTVLTHEIMRKYTSFDSLRKAWKAHSLIPILVPLRNFSGDSAIDRIQKALQAHRTPLDTDLLKALLAEGDFIVVFDGLNEIHSDDQIMEFASLYEFASMIVTSQTLCSVPRFRQYQLPPVTGKFARDLLTLFVGGDTAGPVIESTPNLWNCIESGYDVRLVTDLVLAHRRIPETRIDLYGAIVESAESRGLTAAGKAVVCRLAWNLWLNGKYQFSTDSDLTSEMRTILLNSNIIVHRGQNFEFRHELLRGYLAALWLARDMASEQNLRSRLADKQIWDLASSEQDSVFQFLAALLADAALQEAFDISMENSAVRRELMVAVTEESRKRGFAWSLGLRAESRVATVQ